MKRLIRSFLNIVGGPAFADSKFPVGTLLRCWFAQKVLRINSSVPWPVHWTSKVIEPSKIKRGTRMPGLALGVYIDGRNGIEIGENTWIGPGAKLVSKNHSVENFETYTDDDPIVIGKNCWIASNAVILAGVELGDHTVVAAGAVVTKSFKGTDQVLAGIPAKVVKKISPYTENK